MPIRVHAILLVMIVSSMALGGDAAAPAFQVDVPYPTQDKPQSKLWHAEGHWWAWMPVQGGSSLWKRTDKGWTRQTALDADLRNAPGRADVWADADGVRAVLVGINQLAVAQLKFDASVSDYRNARKPTAWTIEPSELHTKAIESATIGRDSTGRTWIAYDLNAKMWVRSSADRELSVWTKPLEIGAAAADDVCCLVVLPDSVGVIWSDQAADAVRFRRHMDTSQPEEWDAAEIVEDGNRTADDHFNAAVAADGTLYVATKNSLDEIGRPQLVLRIRQPDGRWSNHPYADRTMVGEPSRPIAVLGGDPVRLLLAHTVYSRGPSFTQPSTIASLVVDPSKPNLKTEAKLLLRADNPLNDPTSRKSVGPTHSRLPQLVLASDEMGKVYEILLP